VAERLDAAGLRPGRQNRGMTAADAQRFARSWVESWNAHDLEAVLAHFADDVVFTSPVAARIVPGSDGTVRGKDALRAYWAAGLAATADLRFELESVFAGVEAVVIVFRNQAGAQRCEVLVFDDGLVVQGHGTDLCPA
jgi:ketosteroid isomerase-like protein